MSDQLDTLLRVYLPIVLVLLIAAGVRMFGTATLPVTTDEGWTTWAISEPNIVDVVEKVAADRHPPLYFLALAAWQRVAGESAIALRLLNVLVGVLTVALVCRVADETFGRTAKAGHEDISWYAMLIYAVLPIAVYYTQEIRHYGWFTAATVLSSLAFVRVLRSPTNRRLILYSLSVALMMYLLYYGVWLALIQAFTVLVLWRGNYLRKWRTTWVDRGKVGLAWLGALVIYAPWLFVIARQQWGLLGNGIGAAPGTFSSSATDVLRLMELLLGGGLALTLGLYIVGLWGTLVSDRTDATLGLRFANPLWLGEVYIMLAGAGGFFLLVIANNFVGVLSARTTVFLTPLLAMIVAAGVVRQRIGVRWSLLVGYLLVSLFLAPVFQPRLDSPSAAATLASQYQPGDLIVLETGWDDNAFRYAMRQALGTDANIIRTLPYVNNRDENVPVVPQIEDQLQAATRIWVVQWLQPPQVIPYLDSADSGFTRMAELRSDVGGQYRGQYARYGAADDVWIVGYSQSP
jgi:4-amino-4-deoxy-L-arabinose transferase-like glycosyltransferase